jgi:hypothetical protein
MDSKEKTLDRGGEAMKTGAYSTYHSISGEANGDIVEVDREVQVVWWYYPPAEKCYDHEEVPECIEYEVWDHDEDITDTVMSTDDERIREEIRDRVEAEEYEDAMGGI